jgi:ATP/maltotriose-dependent transcriptional regulator MalT
MEPPVRSGSPDTPAAPAVRGLVSRDALFWRIGTAGRVTVVSAPAGSGKTFLLRSWVDEAGLADRAAGVSVRREERDPQRFWIAVADAPLARAPICVTDRSAQQAQELVDLVSRRPDHPRQP